MCYLRQWGTTKKVIHSIGRKQASLIYVIFAEKHIRHK